MRPRLICHMLSSVDGRINGAALRDVMVQGDYEKTGTQLEGDAWICGRTTMQQHEPFVSASSRPAGAPFTSPGGRSPMQYRSTPWGSSAGQAATWMEIT